MASARQSYGEPVEIRAGCVVGADGYESQVGRWAGIDTTLKPADIDTCYQYRLTGIDYDPDYCVFQLGSDAPGGYVWVFPKNEDTANVGIGVQLSKVKHPGDPKMYLDKYIAKHPGLKKGQPLEAVAGAVSICAPLDSVSVDNLMLVGDSARMIDPITGGGISTSCIAGKYRRTGPGQGCEGQGLLHERPAGVRDRLEGPPGEQAVAELDGQGKADHPVGRDPGQIGSTLSEVGVEKLSVQSLLAVVKSPLS